MSKKRDYSRKYIKKIVQMFDKNEEKMNNKSFF